MDVLVGGIDFFIFIKLVVVFLKEKGNQDVKWNTSLWQ